MVTGLAKAQSWRGRPNLCNFLSNKAALWQPYCPAAALLPWGLGSHSPARTSPTLLPDFLLLVCFCPRFTPLPLLRFLPCSGVSSLCYCVPPWLLCG